LRRPSQCFFVIVFMRLNDGHLWRKTEGGQQVPNGTGSHRDAEGFLDQVGNGLGHPTFGRITCFDGSVENNRPDSVRSDCLPEPCWRQRQEMSSSWSSSFLRHFWTAEMETPTMSEISSLS